MKALLVAALCLLALAPAAVAADPPASMSVQLRLRGSAEAIPPLRACLEKRLPALPDVRVVGKEATSRFVIDAVATTASQNRVTASFVVLSRFPQEEFAPTLEAMPDGAELARQLKYFS